MDNQGTYIPITSYKRNKRITGLETPKGVDFLSRPRIRTKVLTADVHPFPVKIITSLSVQ